MTHSGLAVQVKEITGGTGVNVVYDPVGGDMWDASMRCAANSARLLVIGFASGKVPQVPANILLSRNLDVLGFYVGAYFGEQCVSRACVDLPPARCCPLPYSV
jgi:NADPH2:quinone reductase